MFVPLRDSAELRVIRFQTVTTILIVLNVAVYALMQFLLTDVGQHNTQLALGAIPAVLTGHAQLAAELQWIPELLTPVTSLFMHAGWMHLLGNMLFLWVFADNVEDGLGHGWFLLFYLICGLAGVMLHTLFSPQSQLPLIGASGAISGVLAAYLLLFPRSKVVALLFGVVPVHLSAIWLLIAWVAYQLVFFFIDQHAGVAWDAHIGGFAAGLVLALAFKRHMQWRLSVGEVARERHGKRRHWT